MPVSNAGSLSSPPPDTQRISGFPSHGQESKLSITVTSQKLKNYLRAIQPLYVGLIPFLECVLFFKTKTSDIRLKVSQKLMTQE